MDYRQKPSVGLYRNDLDRKAPLVLTEKHQSEIDSGRMSRRWVLLEDREAVLQDVPSAYLRDPVLGS